LERIDAINQINQLLGKDLRELAKQFEITVFKDGKKNKGWAGHVIERYLGLPINSAQSPNFGSWELKTICLKKRRNNVLTIKETMAITMMDPYNIKVTDFENSHLLSKLRKQVIVARVWESPMEESSIVKAAVAFDLGDTEVYEQIKADYNLIRNTIINEGFEKLSGRMGVYIQPRTKGPGHGSISRAFYARIPFLMKLVYPSLLITEDEIR
jgi:DNA mismatch repair endonuclease MutH